MLALALCDSAVNFKPDQGGSSGSATKNFFTDLISSYSSAMFLQNGRYLVTRDFLTVKLWDLANNKKPVSSVTV
jgi:hypothetical protein